MWTNFLRHGSLILTCLILFGCTRTEWVQFGDWVYRNNSVHKLEIKGAITDFSMGHLQNFILPPGESYDFEFVIDSGKHVDPDGIPCPFDTVPYHLPERLLQITVDENKTIEIDKGTGIRNRDNYQVEKLGERHFRFTYTFTDEVVRELLETQSP